MPEEIRFNPIKEVGSIASSPTSEFRFYIDEFRGRKYAAIRRFLKSPRYTGPTQSGITMDNTLLDSLILTLEKITAQPEEKELARFPRRPGVELVVRISVYRDKHGIDIREWLQSGQYTGWSKRGVRIPYESLAELISLLKKLKPALEGST